MPKVKLSQDVEPCQSAPADSDGARVGQFGMDNPPNQRPIDYAYIKELADYFASSLGDPIDRLRTFTKYVPRSDLGRFLAMYELFQMVLTVPGAIVECGVHLGAGLMSCAQVSSIFEPINHLRRVVGFDTFSGFPALSPVDRMKSNFRAQEGGHAVDSQQDIERALAAFDMTRPVNHIARVELRKGDAIQTIPAYLNENRHTVVALLHLDFDLYEPTRAALEQFVPRMPKGAVIVFDELNDPLWPGETLATMDTLGLSSLRLQRFTHQPQLSYARLD